MKRRPQPYLHLEVPKHIFSFVYWPYYFLLLGAELIAELRQKKMTEQDEQERRILEKIKAKMDKIKANQQKIHETGYKDTSSHFVGKYPFYLCGLQ